MSYTVAAPLRNASLRDKMLIFLDEQYKRFRVLTGEAKTNEEAIAYISDPSGVADRNPMRVGFDYRAGSMIWEREYAFCLVRWMALKVGKLRKFKGIPVPVPYYIYDGYEATPIVVRGSIPTLPRNQSWSEVDKLGIPKPYPASRYSRYSPDIAKAERAADLAERKVIHNELKRLDKLWTKHANIPTRSRLQSQRQSAG